MAKYQCGLCLSCGAPFLPNSKQVSFYNRKGNLSVLYINDEYENSRELREQFKVPKFSDSRDMAHIFHASHHATAIDYMCNHHTGDSDLTWPPDGAKLPLLNGPLPYFKTPTRDTMPRVAVWARPPKENRIDFGTMLEYIVELAKHNSRHNIDARRPQSIAMTYPMCKSCNAVMTATANMRYLIGFTKSSERNHDGCIIPVNSVPIRSRPANPHGRTLGSAYGHWKVGNPEQELEHPSYTADDVMAPHIGYYLHLCLPYLDATTSDPFDARQMPGSVRTARSLYLELSWIVLEIACIATLIEKGHLYDKGSRSHGMQQHWGALDIYVSFFIWRLLEFQHKKQIQRSGLDFTQWHQKYYCDAIHCSALFPGRILPNTIIGLRVCPATSINSRDLVELICENLMELYMDTLDPLVQFVCSTPPTPPLSDSWLFISQYFLPIPSMRALQGMGTQLRENDFESALEVYGVNALLSRAIHLSPPSMRPLLKDFRESWQWLELDRIRTHTPELDMRSARILYVLCCLLDPPDYIPKDKFEVDAILQGPCCSPWTSVLALQLVKAFTDR